MNGKRNGKKKRVPATNRKHEKKVTKVYFVLGGFLFLILLGLLLYSSGVFAPKGEVVRFEIEDECGVIAGNLVHNVANSGGCKIKCNDNCEIRGLEFYDSEFTLQNGTCHLCDCYCR